MPIAQQLKWLTPWFNEFHKWPQTPQARKSVSTSQALLYVVSPSPDWPVSANEVQGLWRSFQKLGCSEDGLLQQTAVSSLRMDNTGNDRLFIEKVGSTSWLKQTCA